LDLAEVVVGKVATWSSL